MCTQVKGPPSEFDPQCGYHILYQSCYLPSLLKAAQELDPYERCRGRWRRLTTPSPWVPSLSFSFSRSRSSSESSAQQRVRRGEKGSGKRVVHSGFKASLASPLLVPSLLSFSPPLRAHDPSHNPAVRMRVFWPESHLSLTIRVCNPVRCFRVWP